MAMLISKSSNNRRRSTRSSPLKYFRNCLTCVQVTNGKFVADLSLYRLVLYLYRLNAGSLTSNRFSKPTYKVAFLRHRRSSAAFPASQECDTGGLKVNAFN